MTVGAGLSAALIALAAVAVQLLVARKVSQRWAVALSAPLAVMAFLLWKSAGHAAATAWISGVIIVAALAGLWRTAKRRAP